MEIRSIGELVKNKFAYFQFYRNEYFHYKTDDGFEFFVPLEDTKGFTLPSKDKAIVFMRWIRKQQDLLSAAKLPPL